MVVDVLINRKVPYLVMFHYGDENLLTSHKTDFYNHALKIMSVRHWSLTDSFTDSVKTVLEENLILQIYGPFFLARHYRNARTFHLQCESKVNVTYRCSICHIYCCSGLTILIFCLFHHTCISRNLIISSCYMTILVKWTVYLYSTLYAKW
jgi:hypothetical protein